MGGGGGRENSANTKKNSTQLNLPLKKKRKKNTNNLPLISVIIFQGKQPYLVTLNKVYNLKVCQVMSGNCKTFVVVNLNSVVYSLKATSNSVSAYWSVQT